MSLTYKICKQCGKPFRVKPSHFHKKFYCGKNCMGEAYRTRMATRDPEKTRRANREHMQRQRAKETAK